MHEFESPRLARQLGKAASNLTFDAAVLEEVVEGKN